MSPVVLVGLLLVLLPCSLVSAAVYKWTDENGVVHFSQTPPPAGASSSPKVEQVQVRGSAQIFPRPRDGKLYCGSQAVPDGMGGNSLQHLRNVRMFLDSYRAEYRRAEQYYREEQQRQLELQQRGFEYRPADEQNRRLQEIACLVSWAEAELTRNDGQKADYQAEYQQLKQRYQALSMRKERDCPNRAGTLIGSAAEAWVKCDRELSPEMNKLKKRLNELQDLVE